MKRIKPILAALFSLLSLTLTAQKVSYLGSDFSNFLGVWVATDNDISYELEFVREIVAMNMPERTLYSEMVLGKLVYKKGDIIMRQTEIDGFASIIYIWQFHSEHKGTFKFRDESRRVRAHIEFSINESDPLKAVFKLVKYEGSGSWNKENKIDIPDGITFYKVVE